MAAIAFVWLFLTGLGMVHWAMPSARLGEKLGLAFPLSAGLHAVVYFILMQCCRASVLWSTAAFIPFIFVASQVRCRGCRNWSAWDGLALAFIFLSLVRVAVHLVVIPAVEWDSVAMWIFKGKALLAEGALTSDLASWLGPAALHPEYPWNVPMMHAWVGRMAGHFSETASKWIYVFYFGSLLVILYSLARLRWQRTGSFAFVAAYLGIPMVFVVAFNRDADMILETLIAAVIFLALRYQAHPGGGTIGLMAAAVFLCCWTKIEGIVFSGLLLPPYLLILSVRWRRRENAWLIFGVTAATVAGFLAFWIPKQVFGSTTIFAHGVTSLAEVQTGLARVGAVSGAMFQEMVNVTRWNLAWFLVPVLLWTGRDQYGLKLLFVGQVAVYFGVYFFTPLDLAWHMQTSLSRVLSHTVPALFAWSVFALPVNGGKSAPAR